MSFSSFLTFCCFFGLVTNHDTKTSLSSSSFVANIINTGMGIELRTDNNVLISLPIKNYYTFKYNGEMEIFDHEKSKIFLIRKKFQNLRCFREMCKFCNTRGDHFLTKPIVKSYELAMIAPQPNGTSSILLRIKKPSPLETLPLDILLYYEGKGLYGRIFQSFTSLFYSSRNILKINSFTKALILRCKYCYVIDDNENNLLKSSDTGNLINCTNYLFKDLEKFCHSMYKKNNILGKK